METTKIESGWLKESYLKIRHDSGLTILLYPMKGYSTAYAIFGADYGSIDNAFKTDPQADFTEVPDGIAHYLEHKLFESEEGDAFSLFAKTGADANAYTSFDKTCYLFSCADHFEESLRYLIRFVQSPYFTPQTVEKEQGIIGQEIRMYDDTPSWQVMFGLLESLYHPGHPVRTDIAGTVESIAKITPELLYTCYNTFYNPANMAIAITGNFDPDAALTIISEELKDVSPVPVIRREVSEPPAAFSPRKEREMEVSEPLFCFGYKIPPAKTPEEEIRLEVTLSILMDILAGPTSDFYEALSREGLLNDTFSNETFGGRGYLSALFSGESKDPDAVYAAFNRMVEEKKASGLSKEDFNACKGAVYGESIKETNNVETVANTLISYEMMGVSPYLVPEMIADITLEETQETLRRCFLPEKEAISVIRPAAASGREE